VRVPWAALPGRREGTVLLDDYALAVVPNGHFLLDQLSSPSPSEAGDDILLAVGGVAYDARPRKSIQPPKLLVLRSAVQDGGPVRWTPLSGSKQEIDQLAALAGGRKRVELTGPEASTAAVLAELPEARWAHLATHGFFADKKFRSALQLEEGEFEERHRLYGDVRRTVAGRNPLVLSGLVLAGANLPRDEDPLGLPQGDGGILTAEAIAGLDLSKLHLAVLSACETGLGDVAGGEGVFGLQRAFQIAGARNVVASLWKVDDKATADLMWRFYENLWQGKMPPIEALRQAQLYVYRHPDEIGKPAAGRGLGVSRPVTLPGGGDVKPGSKTAPTRQWAGFVLAGAGD
jgi:CHAT domain-containing protein